MIRSLGNGQRSALIVNECQVGILDPRHALFPELAQQAVERGLVASIAALLRVFRDRDLPVLHTPAFLRPDLRDKQVNTLIAARSSKARTLVQGTVGSGYMPGLEPLASEFVIPRTAGLIAFHGTSLDVTLRRLGVETLVLTGVSTNVAIPGLAMAATDLGYHVVVPEDCIAGSDPDVHRVIVDHQLRMLATLTTKDEVIAALG